MDIPEIHVVVFALKETLKKICRLPLCGHHGCGFGILSAFLPFSSHLSTSVALQQSSVLKLLVAGLQSVFVLLQGSQIGR